MPREKYTNQIIAPGPYSGTLHDNKQFHKCPICQHACDHHTHNRAQSMDSSHHCSADSTLTACARIHVKLFGAILGILIEWKTFSQEAIAR